MSQDKEQEAQQQLLQRKPERPRSFRLSSFLPFIGGIVIIGMMLIIVWQVLSMQNVTNGTQQTTNQTKNNQGGQNAVPPWEHYPAIYWQTLREQVAQGFHMTTQQMKAKLQAIVPAVLGAGPSGKKTSVDPGQPLSDLATQSGITLEQLHNFEVNAVQKAHDIMMQQGYITRQQASDGVRSVLNVDQSTLNWHMIDAFLNH